MVSLKDYQTDCLFLLVGTNPLPNFVSALLLAKDQARIILLHTADTGEVAEDLKWVIDQRKLGVLVEMRQIDIRCGDRILKYMNDLLEGIDPKSSLGLNYTGGTKAMSVHTYQALKKAAAPAVFSYLDARTLSLMIDTKDDDTTKKIYIGQDCPVQLKEILSLHGYRVYTVKQGQVHPDFCRVLAEIYSNKDAYEQWKEWLKKLGNEAIEPKTLPTKSEYPALTKVIDKIDEICDGKPSPGLFAQKLGRDKLSRCKDFLEGKWLDEYTFCSVGQLVEDLGLNDLCLELEAKKPRKFELDVVFVRGYQLFALSCKASSNKNKCKLGLFEAFTRARQLGGDEARVGLVCCYNQPGQLQQEIEESWFAKGQVKVFGMSDLLNLQEGLREWINTTNN